MMKINMMIVAENKDLVTVPKRATDGSAGLDLAAAIPDDKMLKPGERAIIPTGLAFDIPNGYEGQVRPRSGLAFKYGVTVLNSPGTIDSDYQGEVKVILINHGDKDFIVTKGMRIAQIVIAKYENAALNQVKNFDVKTERGAKGFGSSGTH